MTRATFATAAVAVALSILALAKPRKHTPAIPPQPEPETPRWWSPSRFPGAVLSQVLAGLIVVGLLAMMHQLTMVRTSYPSAPKDSRSRVCCCSVLHSTTTAQHSPGASVSESL